MPKKSKKAMANLRNLAMAKNKKEKKKKIKEEGIDTFLQDIIDYW